MENNKNSMPIKPMGPIVHGRKRYLLISRATRKDKIVGTKPLVIILHEYAKAWQ